MLKISSKLLLFLVFSVQTLFSQDLQTVERKNWENNTTNTTITSAPTNLKYYKYFDVLPDEINYKIFDKQDLSNLAGKKLYVGYGVAMQSGRECKTFKKEDTGLATDTVICLPWWRIEREYKKKLVPSAATSSFLDTLRVQKPPMNVSYCKQWSDGKIYNGGIVTCTTYFDKNAGGDCWSNPEQQKCYVDNCGSDLKNRCKYLDSSIGNKDTLPSSVFDPTMTPTQQDTKIKLATHSFDCPSGPINDKVECVDEKNVIMSPYTCKEDDGATPKDDGEYIYCDESKPLFKPNGDIQSFQGKCSDGKVVECKVNSFKNVTKVCTQPIYETVVTNDLKSSDLVRTYFEKTVDVLSGEPDIYSGQANCLRANTIEEAREQQLYVKIVGDGSLDDDIYVLRHKTDGSHTKVYCNMQHAENRGSKKSYNGDTLQCIDNDGSYSFNQTVGIDTTDIVTVQQNSENENATGTPFLIGRNHYSSTEVVIDSIEVAPKTFANLFPAYPSNSSHLRTWDNTNSTVSILFPFAGAYEIYFYNKNNEEVAVSTLDIEDFKQISQNAALQLKLGKTMKLAPGISDTTINREDMWAEWGGGVFGGKDSKTGAAANVPNDDYVKENAITNIIVKDLLTSAVVPIKLTYPLPYPNRVFISRLKVYEYRKYRCYNDFDKFSLLGNKSQDKYVCSTTNQWQNYVNNVTSNVSDAQQWQDKSLCEQNCRTTFQCAKKVVGSQTGYSCMERGGENLGGDLGGNLFTSKDTCDASCYAQNSCATYNQNSCTIVDEKPSEPISDYTGRTLYRKKSVTYSCENRVDKQIGCAQYDVKVAEGELNFDFSAVGHETKDFSGNFEKSLTKAQMLEVGQQHIFSGWKGKCVKGMKWDFSYLSDPMTIMSYAMSAYSAADAMSQPATGAAQAGAESTGWVSDMQNEFNSFKDSINTTMNDALTDLSKSSIGEAYKSVVNPIKDAYNATATSISEGVGNIQKELGMEASNSIATNTTNSPSAWDSAKDAYNKMEQQFKDAKAALEKSTGIKWGDTVKIGDTPLKYGNYINITNGSLITFGRDVAMNLLATPSRDDYITADKLLKGYVGINTEDNDVHNYNACMASIGASLPSLIGWSADSYDKASEQLIEPWKHPLRMTPDQLASIAVVTSNEYVKSQFMYEETDNILLNVIAITQPAYLKAAETICMGTKVAQAAEHIQSKNNSKGLSSSAIALGVAKAALSMVCAPCGFAATVVMDLATNVFAKIDTCSNEKDAMQWDMLDFKTNKFMNKEQCHFVKSSCDQMANFGIKKKCVRDKYEYCCYDQITTRIFAEGLKIQLGKDWSSCNDIGVDDLKDVNFRECRTGEIANINKCFPTEQFSDFQKVLFRQASKNINSTLSEGLVNQAINSMSINKQQ